MGEREGGEELGVGAVVEPRVHAVARARHVPEPRAHERAVDRQAAVVARDQRRAGVEDDPAAGDLVAPRVEPVGPGVQDRDAARAEQLLAAVAQRAAEHPRAGHEARGELVATRVQLERARPHELGNRSQGHGWALP
jgi:hypothetical protein